MAFLGAAHFFYSWAVFGLDNLFRGVKIDKSISRVVDP